MVRVVALLSRYIIYHLSVSYFVGGIPALYYMYRGVRTAYPANRII